MGGDGLLGAIAGELRGTDGVLVRAARAGAGTTSPASSASGRTPSARARCSTTAASTAIDVADAGGATFLGIASAGIDSDVQIIANATRIPLGGMIYVVSTLRALARWHRARLGGRGRRGGARLHRVLGRGGELGRLRRRHVPRARRAARRRAARRRPAARLPAAEVPREPAAGVPGHARAQPRPHLPARRARSASAPSRPFAAYADGDPIAELPVTITRRAPRPEGARPVTLLGPEGGRRQGGRRASCAPPAAAAGRRCPGRS